MSFSISRLFAEVVKKRTNDAGRHHDFIVAQNVKKSVSLTIFIVTIQFRGKRRPTGSKLPYQPCHSLCGYKARSP